MLFMLSYINKLIKSYHSSNKYLLSNDALEMGDMAEKTREGSLVSQYMYVHRTQIIEYKYTRH
jgi:hypothetical protein